MNPGYPDARESLWTRYRYWAARSRSGAGAVRWATWSYTISGDQAAGLYRKFSAKDSWPCKDLSKFQEESSSFKVSKAWIFLHFDKADAYDINGTLEEAAALTRGR